MFSSTTAGLVDSISSCDVILSSISNPAPLLWKPSCGNVILVSETGLLTSIGLVTPVETLAFTVDDRMMLPLIVLRCLLILNVFLLLASWRWSRWVLGSVVLTLDVWSPRTELPSSAVSCWLSDVGCCVKTGLTGIPDYQQMKKTFCCTSVTSRYCNIPDIVTSDSCVSTQNYKKN